MKKMLKKSKGFTLVELLIVIIIIGILAGMMMLASGSATDKAEATKIVSNLRNVKAAAIMYYADHNNWPSKDVAINDNSMSDVAKYLDSTNGMGEYKFVAGKATGSLYVQRTAVAESIAKICNAMSEKSSLSVDVSGASSTVAMPVHQ